MGSSQTFVLLTLISLSLVVAANLILRFAWGRFLLQVSPLAFATIFLLVSFLTPSSSWLYGVVTWLGALAIAAPALPQVRRQLARFLPIDPLHPLHTTALALALALIFNHFSVYLALQNPSPQASDPVHFYDQLINFTLMVGLAVFGVGTFTRRPLASLWPRLGLRRPNRFQIFFAVGAGSAFQLVALIAYALSHLLTPALAQSVDQNSQALLDPILSATFFFIPVGILFLALSAAFGEEALFRGALQPRLGLLVAALLFTAFHDQYGFSFDLALIFLLALVLGWLRNSMNLWACIVAHFWYDCLASLGLDYAVVIGAGAAGLALCLLLVHSYHHRLFVPAGETAIRWHQV